jgi:hypothetical protein
MAETTTTTWWPWSRFSFTFRATRRIFSTSATDEPPYFWTTVDIGNAPPRGLFAARFWTPEA